MGLFTRQNILSLLIPVSLVCSFKVAADSPGRPQPYVFESGDYVYVQFAGFEAENKDEYLERSAGFYNKRCKNRARIAEYEKRRCNTLDAIRRYPHSGVFHKDNPSEPVWWGGRCGGASHMTTDANYVVQMGPWAGHISQQAFRICKRHKVIAEYAIEDLVDDESRLPRSVSHFSWIAQKEFDAKSARLFIKTLDNNEYTFDLHTGKIIEYKYTPFKSFEALVFLKNKKTQIVRDITSCSGMTYATMLMGNGFPVHQLQVVEPVKQEKGGELVQMGAFPFEYIREARFISKADHRAIWEITTPQGQSEEVMIDSSGADLCGKDNDGKEIEISMLEIESLKMSLTKSVPSRKAIRTVEQRMSWDIKQWDQARREVCEKTQLEPYKSERTLMDMLRLFQKSNCTDQFRNFVIEMEKTNQWLKQQQLEYQMLTVAQNVAKFQLESGLSNQAMSLYKHLLEIHKTPDKRNTRVTYLRAAYLRRILAASYQAGLLDEYKKYRKLYNIADAIRQKHDAEIRAKQDKENRSKIKDYQQSIAKISISSVKPDHAFPEDRKMKSLLKWECRDKKTTAISAVDVYKSILALERKIHPEGHNHVLEAAMSVTDCYKQKKNYVQAKKSFDKVLSRYLQMDKNGELSAENSQAINRKLKKLTFRLTQDQNEVIDAKIELDLRMISRLRELNKDNALFNTLRELAENYKSTGDYGEAEKCYKERVQLSAKLGGKYVDIANSSLERYYKFIERVK